MVTAVPAGRARQTGCSRPMRHRLGRMAEDDEATGAEGEQAEPAEKEREPIGAGQYVAPVMMRKAFHCVYCGVYAPHGWRALAEPGETLSGARREGSTPIRRA